MSRRQLIIPGAAAVVAGLLILIGLPVLRHEWQRARVSPNMTNSEVHRALGAPRHVLFPSAVPESRFDAGIMRGAPHTRTEIDFDELEVYSNYGHLAGWHFLGVYYKDGRVVLVGEWMT